MKTMKNNQYFYFSLIILLLKLNINLKSTIYCNVVLLYSSLLQMFVIFLFVNVYETEVYFFNEINKNKISVITNVTTSY